MGVGPETTRGLSPNAGAVATRRTKLVPGFVGTDKESAARRPVGLHKSRKNAPVVREFLAVRHAPGPLPLARFSVNNPFRMSEKDAQAETTRIDDP